jgi:hypothetical protein
MTKLSDTQLVILSNACQRDDRLVLPLPDRLKGGAAAKVVDSLLAKGLVAEIPAERDQPVWRQDDDGRRLTLVAADAAFADLGIEADEAPTAAEESVKPESAEVEAIPQGSPPAQATAAPARRTREGSKQAQLIAMLRRPEGASIEEIVAAFGWQAHTVRGAIAGALKKKLGLDVTSEKVEGRGRVYRIG